MEKIFAIIEPQGRTCDAIVGITDEGTEVTQKYKNLQALDPGLLAAVPADEHYEISCYGTLKTCANELRLTEVVSLLEPHYGKRNRPTRL